MSGPGTFVIESVDPLDTLTLKQRELLVSLRGRAGRLRGEAAVYRLRRSSGRGRRWLVVATADPALQPGAEVVDDEWVATRTLALVDGEPVEVELALAARLVPASPPDL
jgi:hypothetical protein